MPQDVARSLIIRGKERDRDLMACADRVTHEFLVEMTRQDPDFMLDRISCTDTIYALMERRVIEIGPAIPSGKVF